MEMSSLFKILSIVLLNVLFKLLYNNIIHISIFMEEEEKLRNQEAAEKVLRSIVSDTFIGGNNYLINTGLLTTLDHRRMTRFQHVELKPIWDESGEGKGVCH